MPTAIKQHRPLLTLKPRLQTLASHTKTLKQKQRDNGRTLALDGAAWRKLRAHVLAGEPMCRHCTQQGALTIASDVDHRDNDPSNNELVNLVPMCHECHSRKTARDMGHNVRMGCDLNGMPLDPSHPWNNAPEPVLMRPDADLKRSLGTDGHKPTVTPSFNANRESVV